VPLQSIPTGLKARPQGTDLADNSFDEVECTTHHPGSRGVANSVYKDLAVAISTRPGPAEDDPLLYK